MRLRAAALAFAACANVSCSAFLGKRPNLLPGQILTDSTSEYAVYQAVLGYNSVRGVNTILLAESTIAVAPAGAGLTSFTNSPSGALPRHGPSRQQMERFVERQAQRRRLRPESLVSWAPVVLVPESIVRSGDWRSIHRAHSRTSNMLLVSRVSFDDAYRQAIVYVSDLCGPLLCGRSALNVFVRGTDGRWRRERELFVLWH